MNRAQAVFRAIDILGYPVQNAVHFGNVSCVKDIPYSDKGGRSTQGDLYYRTDIRYDGKKHPVIVYIHGGGFIMGDKDYRVSVSEYYASRGYYVYCINNRLAPETPFPGTIFDCVDAVNYLPALAERFSIDTDRVVLTGDSSGAYMCAYVASLRYNPALRLRFDCPEIVPDFAGLMLMCGIYDIKVLLKGTTLFGVIPQTGSMLFNFPLKKDLSNVQELPILDVVSPADFVNENWCSTFLCWADDDIICQGQGEPMAQKLEAVGALGGTYHCKGILNNHCYHLMLKGNKYAKECMQSSLDYLSTLFSASSSGEQKKETKTTAKSKK